MTHEGKVEQVYNFLLMRLLRMDYKTNDRLVISQIAAQCGVSDTPVREALRRLESEGYVKITANQGATVIGFTQETMREIAEIKGVLEGYATRISVDYLSLNDLRTLNHINEQMHEAAIAGDCTRYAELNTLFHESIYQHANKGEWLRLIKQLWSKWHFTAQVFSQTPERMIESYKEHQEILRLLEAREYDKVEAFMRQHKQNALMVWGDALPHA